MKKTPVLTNGRIKIRGTCLIDYQLLYEYPYNKVVYKLAIRNFVKICLYGEQNIVYCIFIPGKQSLALQKICLSVGKKSCASNKKCFSRKDEDPDDRDLEKLGAGLFGDIAERKWELICQDSIIGSNKKI